MAIIDALLPLRSEDIVGVFNDAGEQLFVRGTPQNQTFGFSTNRFFGGQIKAQPLSMNVSRETQVFSHPLEDGTVITDHRIILPIQIQMKFIISEDSTGSIYQEFENLLNFATEVNVKTKARTFPRMFVSSLPHLEDPSKFNALELDIVFTERQTITGPTFTPATQDLEDTNQLGEIATVVGAAIVLGVSGQSVGLL